VSFVVAGKTVTELEIVPPFTTTVFVPKAVPGTYTFPGAGHLGQGDAAIVRVDRRRAEAKDQIDWFADGPSASSGASTSSRHRRRPRRR